MRNFNGLITLVVLVLGLVLGACQPTAPATPDPPKDISEVPRISVEELKERLDNGEAILIVDARSNVEFETEHIAGAIRVPVHEVEASLDELPRDQEIVFYCT